MAGQTAEGSYGVTCPHCKKPFEAELMTAASASSSAGFKCPHCRLFVPLERSNGEPRGDGAA